VVEAAGIEPLSRARFAAKQGVFGSRGPLEALEKRGVSEGADATRTNELELLALGVRLLCLHDPAVAVDG
jgi:hypothetical protein